MALTETLRDQHAQLRTMLEQVRRCGVATAEGCALLQQAQRLVVAHLKLEESKLYPALRAHPETQQLAHQYADEMEKLTPSVVAFFDTYREGSTDGLGFARNLGQLLGVLNQRMTREEVRLYPAFEAHCEPAKA